MSDTTKPRENYHEVYYGAILYSHFIIAGAAAKLVSFQHIVQPRAGQAPRLEGRRRPKREGGAVPRED